MILAVKGSRLAAYSFPRSLSFTTPLLGQLTQEILEWDRLPELAGSPSFRPCWDVITGQKRPDRHAECLPRQ